MYLVGRLRFQSVFMLTDQVIIETKSYFTEEYQIIELNSPNSIKDGGILVQKKKSTHKIKPGTKLSFKFKTKAIPTSWTIKGGHSNANRAARNYDPFSNVSLDIELGKIFDEIFDFSHKSYTPIKLFFNKKAIETKNNLSKFKYFNPDDDLELNIFPTNSNNHNIITFYKNQIFKSKMESKFLDFELNVHKDLASRVLLLNRNEINPDYSRELEAQFLNSSFDVIIKNFEKIFDDLESKIKASMFLHYYANKNDILKEHDISNFNHWRQFKIKIKNNKIELHKIFNKIDRVSIKIEKDYAVFQEDQFELNKKELLIKIYRNNLRNDSTLFILFMIRKLLPSFKRIDGTNPTFQFSNEEQLSPISERYLKTILSELKDSRYTARKFIPCIKKYFNLRLKDDAHKSYVYRYRLSYNIDIHYPKMLSPFTSIENAKGENKLFCKLDDDLYKWVFDNRFNEDTTKQDIVNSYKKFISDFPISEIG